MKERRGGGGQGRLWGSCDVQCICTLHPHACISLCVSTCGLSESRHHDWEGKWGDSRYDGKEGGGVSGEIVGIM